MRVVQITDTFRPTINGVVRSIEVANDGLAGAGVPTDIVEPGTHGAIPCPIYPGLMVALRPVRASDLAGCDVAHIHTPGMLGLTGAEACRKASLPLVYTYHSRLPEIVSSVLPPAIRRVAIETLGIVEQRILNAADVVIAPSRAVGKALRRSHGIDARVVPTALPSSFLKEAARLRAVEGGRLRRNPGTGFVVGYLGRLSPEKRVEFVLHAFARVRHLLPNPSLNIGGRGPSLPSLKRLARRLRLTVNWLGGIDDRALPSVYASWDVFVTASRIETQCLSIAEALASGVHVICPDLPELRESSDSRFATFYRADDIDDLSSAMLSAAAWVPRDASAAQIRRLEPQRMASRLIQVYASLIGE